MWPGHAIRSGIAITKLLLGRDILKKKNNNNNNKGEMRFFENIFSPDIFLLSGLDIVHTASSLAQEQGKSILWRNLV